MNALGLLDSHLNICVYIWMQKWNFDCVLETLCDTTELVDFFNKLYPQILPDDMPLETRQIDLEYCLWFQSIGRLFLYTVLDIRGKIAVGTQIEALYILTKDTFIVIWLKNCEVQRWTPSTHPLSTLCPDVFPTDYISVLQKINSNCQLPKPVEVLASVKWFGTGQFLVVHQSWWTYIPDGFFTSAFSPAL